MKRSPMPRKPKARKVDPSKPDTRSRVDKGPLRDPEHLARVRTLPCLVCGAGGVQAHHLRLGLRTMGVRKPDSACVPLCFYHHGRLHAIQEEAFWLPYSDIDPTGYAARIYAETLALRKSSGAKATSSGVAGVKGR